MRLVVHLSPWEESSMRLIVPHIPTMEESTMRLVVSFLPWEESTMRLVVPLS